MSQHNATILGMTLGVGFLASCAWVPTNLAVASTAEGAAIRAAASCQDENQDLCEIIDNGDRVCTLVCAQDCGQTLNQLPLGGTIWCYTSKSEPCTDDMNCLYDVLDTESRSCVVDPSDPGRGGP